MISAPKIAVGPAFSAMVRAPQAKPATPASGPKTQTQNAALPPRGDKPMASKDDDLDPMARRAAQLAPPMQIAPAPVEQASTVFETHARVSLEEILPALVKKIAWAGDGKRGSVRIELGAGELAGSTLLVHADDGKVRVELDVPPGVDAHAWRERIHEKLSARGLDVESVEVR